MEEQLAEKMKREQADQFDTMQKELNEKSEKLKEFNRSKAEIEKLLTGEGMEPDHEAHYRDLLRREEEGEDMTFQNGTSKFNMMPTSVSADEALRHLCGMRNHLRGNFKKVKDEFVKEPFPAWTAIGCTELAVEGARVEIRVVADCGT